MNLMPEDSDDSMCSVSSRSVREVKQRACFYFYSDESTGISTDEGSLIKTEAIDGGEYQVLWDGVPEKVLVIAVGGKLSEIKESQEEFEKVLNKCNLSPKEVVEKLEGKAQERAKGGKRRAMKCKNSAPAVNFLGIPSPQGPHPNRDPISNAIGIALGEEDPQDFQFPAPAGATPVPVPLESGVINEGNTLIELDGLPSRVSIDSELANAVDDMERGDILMRHARKYLKNTPFDDSVLLHPGFNIYIKKGDKIGALSNETTPKRLQEELLMRLFGREYIRCHSAKGQRVSKGGNPAACKATMDAIDAYVKTKLKGEVVPRLSKTYNHLAKNLRVSSGYQAGKYRYISQKR
ncbi:uncharacterized protein LOC124173327 [Ischnura elegans]|uniref:uncharacterized protein LOC124173327 n=1 Tax=Ischnura elegans TaxID=197161 RepID=UPI001ED8BF29|nr:uncharacterized protein LOC124173327 [Ischnura elegans]